MWKCLAVMVAAIVMSQTAFAQDAAVVFAALDTDRNGTLSPMEAQRNSTVSANFAAADANNDGALSREEFIAAFGQN
jgi:hypothetical protein